MPTVQTPAPVLRVAACVAQHRGDRSEQQDRAAVLTSSLDPRCLLGVVADGVGGRSGGAHAAQAVIEVSRRRFARHDPRRHSPREFFEGLVRELHDHLRADGALAGLEPRSTFAALLLEPAQASWCHVGDSRIYRLRPSRAPERTWDHTYESLLVREAGLAPERARRHPLAGRLVHCLGAAHRPRPVIEDGIRVEEDDCFMLCSDGVWAHLPDAEIAQLAHALPPRKAAAEMIARARVRARGRGDNCSVALLRIDAAASAAGAQPLACA